MRRPGESAGVRPRRVVSRFASAEVLEERLALSVFSVTNTNDTGAGSLRTAISDANAVGGADTIVFDTTVFSTPREIVVGDALPQIGGAGLSIVGPGSSLLTVRMGPSGIGFRRVFDSYADRLALSGMTLTGGNVRASGGAVSINGLRPDAVLDDMVLTGNTSNAANDGGAISLTNNSTLTLRNSTLTNNQGRFGGGIFFFLGGSLVMENCTVSNNRSLAMDGHNASGGGIYFYGPVSTSPPAGFTPGTLLVRNSTISGNQGPGSGGGILLDGFSGTLLLQNSTISGNSAGVSGGGIANLTNGTITLENCTVTGNSAAGTATGTNSTGGGGIARWDHTAGTININNSVVSGNTNSRAPDLMAEPLTTTNVQYSAVGSNTGFTMSAASGNNVAFNANLMLGPLANNGGRTLTHALLQGSPLIDAGDNARVPTALVNDQRGAGFARIAGPAVDIGAYERAVPAREVTRIFVGGSAWMTPFRTYIQQWGLGESVFGFNLATGADQLKALPWTGVDRISLRFTSTPTTSVGSLSLRGVNTGNYPAVAYQYDPGKLTATWTLAQPLRNDKLLLELNGGEFRFRFNALPGDTNRSGSVLADDFSAVKKRFFKNTTSPVTGADTDYSIFHDVDGSGSILANDFSEVKRRFFNTLPGPEPTGVAPAGPVGLEKSPFYAGAARVSEEILA